MWAHVLEQSSGTSSTSACTSTSCWTALVSAVLLILTSAPRLFHRAWVTAPLVAHAWEVLCPLLASACCALQLLFNLLNAGCAGFNKIIAFLPELLHLYQTRFRRKRRDRPRGSLRALRRVELRVPGMGCVACINKVQEALSAVPGVHLCDAWLEQGAGGFATVSCTPSTSSGALLSALHHAGFDAERKDCQPGQPTRSPQFWGLHCHSLCRASRATFALFDDRWDWDGVVLGGDPRARGGALPSAHH
eukprot:g6739.t1